MRPKKERKISCSPEPRFFTPRTRSFAGKGEQVHLQMDGFEALRLADFNGLSHAEAARRMGVSRPTFSRILSQARKKTAAALTENKPLKIEGGCCKFEKGKKDE